MLEKKTELVTIIARKAATLKELNILLTDEAQQQREIFKKTQDQLDTVIVRLLAFERLASRGVSNNAERTNKK
jgi:uncharacterized coiled-coil protein SlyX